MNPEKPVALIHSYWLDQNKQDKKPDLWGRLQILAALELLRQGKVERIVFTPGHKVRGKSVAEAYARHLYQINPKVGPDKITFIPKALTTRGEVSCFKKQAQLHGWNNFVDVAVGWHLPRPNGALRREFGSAGGNIPVRTAEQILTQEIPESRARRYRGIVAKAQGSAEWHALKEQADFLNKVESLPGGSLVVEIAARILPHHRQVIREKVGRIFGKAK